MPLSLVGSATNYDNSGSTWSSQAMTLDAGRASGDLAVIILSWYSDSTDYVTFPASAITGFTQRVSNVVYDGSGGTASVIDVWTRDCDGTEAATYTVARSANTWYAGATLFVLRGSSALSYVSIGSSGTVTNGTSVAAPSVSGTSGQGLISVYGLNSSGGTYTPPGSMTLGGGNGTTGAMTARGYFETLAATEPTGTRTLAFTNTLDAIGYNILVNGAGAGGGPFDIAQSGNLALPATITISGEIGNEASYWTIPSNIPESTVVSVIVFNGTAGAYTIRRQGIATVEAGGIVRIASITGTPGDKALAFVHNWNDNTATTSIYGGAAIATRVDE